MNYWNSSVVDTKDYRKNLLLLTAVGFLVRLAYLFYQGADLSFSDEHRFLGGAQKLLQEFHLSYAGEVAHDMPLTSISIAIMLKISGGSLYGPKLFFITVSSLNIYLIGLLAYQIKKVPHVAVLASFIACFYPFFIFYAPLLLSETLFVFFITLIFYLVLKENSGSTLWVSLSAGVAHLVRPTLLFFYPILILWLAFFKNRPVKFIVLSGLIFFLIVSPWAIRNYQQLGVFLFTTSGSGQVLWEANNPWNTTGGVSGSYDKSRAYLDEIPEFKNEYEKDNYKKNKAIQFILDNPVQFAELAWKKFKRFWNLWPNSSQYQALKYKITSIASFGTVLLFFLIWLCLPGSINRYTLTIPAFIGYYTVMHLIVVSSIRYRLPIEPLMIACASVAIVFVWDKVCKKFAP